MQRGRKTRCRSWKHEERIAKSKTNLAEGDKVTLAMRGDAAKQYLMKKTGKDEISSDLEISVIAEVAQYFSDGRILVGLVDPLRKNGEKDRLLTISAIVNPKAINTATIPKGTRIYASPADFEAGQKPHLTEQDSTQSTVALADVKEVTIRTWVAEQD